MAASMLAGCREHAGDGTAQPEAETSLIQWSPSALEDGHDSGLPICDPQTGGVRELIDITGDQAALTTLRRPRRRDLGQRFTMICTSWPRAVSHVARRSIVTLSRRPRRALDSVGWSVPQSRAASVCVSWRCCKADLIAIISLALAASSAASAVVKPISSKTLPPLASNGMDFIANPPNPDRVLCADVL